MYSGPPQLLDGSHPNQKYLPMGLTTTYWAFASTNLLPILLCLHSYVGLWRAAHHRTVRWHELVRKAKLGRRLTNGHRMTSDNFVLVS